MLNRRHWIGLSLAVVGAGLSPALAQQPPVTAIYIKNLHCEGCAKRLRARLYKVPDVLKVSTNLKQGVAVITPTQGTSVSLKALWEAAETEKFQVSKVSGPQGVFNKKPSA